VANRYWVGGAATWDGTALLKWALTSGGIGGQAVPTTADTVFFDAASGANTVTIGAGTATCSTLTMTGFTGTLAFGTNNITIAGSGPLFTGATTFTVTGTPVINNTYSGTNSRSITTNLMTEANSISFNISAGGGTFTFANGATVVKNLNFTGFTGTLANGIRTIYGNLTIPSGMTLTAGTNATTFGATSGTQTITSNAQTLDFPITINGVGGTVQLVDALTLGSTRTFTLTNGTFNSNAKSVTVGAFLANNTNTKTATITNSTITILSGNATTLGFNITATGSSINLTGSSIIFTTSSVAIFYGGGNSFTYPQVTMSGTGQLIIGASSANTNITTLTNTVQPCTISLRSTGATTTVTNFNVNGTAGNLVTLNCDVAGTAKTLSKTSGTVNALYLNVQDNTATGGAKWYANSSNDLGNNTGWNIFNNSFLAVF
jgi:hypothetical protein